MGLQCYMNVGVLSTNTENATPQILSLGLVIEIVY